MTALADCGDNHLPDAIAGAIAKEDAELLARLAR